MIVRCIPDGGDEIGGVWVPVFRCAFTPLERGNRERRNLPRRSRASQRSASA